MNPLVSMEAQDSDKSMPTNPVPKRARLELVAWVLLLVMLLGAQSFPAGLLGSKDDGPDEKKAKVRKPRDEMLADFYASNPALQDSLDKPAGYATWRSGLPPPHRATATAEALVESE
jgi:hypothetical protein